jgi:hypothetical protein
MKKYFYFLFFLLFANCAYQTDPSELGLTSTLKIENTSGTSLIALYLWQNGNESGKNQIQLVYGLTGLVSGDKPFSYSVNECDEEYNLRVDFYRGILLDPLPYTATAYFECNRTVTWKITGESEGQIIYK